MNGAHWLPGHRNRHCAATKTCTAGPRRRRRRAAVSRTTAAPHGHPKSRREEKRGRARRARAAGARRAHGGFTLPAEAPGESAAKEGEAREGGKERESSRRAARPGRGDERPRRRREEEEDGTDGATPAGYWRQAVETPTGAQSESETRVGGLRKMRAAAPPHKLGGGVHCGPGCKRHRLAST